MSKYDVLTLHREWENVCVVRLRGFDNRVFWREIKLVPRFFWQNPRQKIINAQIAAQRKAEQLQRADDIAAHEFNSVVRGS